eukprot:Nk52_evm28s210 gene=Nk52_evmTU28s210
MCDTWHWIDYLLDPSQLDTHLDQLRNGTVTEPSPPELIKIFFEQAVIANIHANTPSQEEETDEEDNGGGGGNSNNNNNNQSSSSPSSVGPVGNNRKGSSPSVSVSAGGTSSSSSSGGGGGSSGAEDGASKAEGGELGKGKGSVRGGKTGRQQQQKTAESPMEIDNNNNENNNNNTNVKHREGSSSGTATAEASSGGDGASSPSRVEEKPLFVDSLRAQRLRYLATRVVTFLGLSLEYLEQNLSIAFQGELIKEFVVTQDEISQEVEIKSETKVSVVQAHRWIVRAVNRGLALCELGARPSTFEKPTSLEPSKNVKPISLAECVNILEETAERHYGFVKAKDNSLYPQWPAKSADCFVTNEELCCQINYDLGEFHFLHERFHHAQKCFIVTKELKAPVMANENAQKEGGEYAKGNTKRKHRFCSVDWERLDGYVTACCALTSSAGEDVVPAFLEGSSLLYRAEKSRHSLFNGIVDLLIEDNRQDELPWTYRRALASDVLNDARMEAQLANDIHFKIIVCNAVKMVMAGRSPDLLFYRIFDQTGLTSKEFDFLFEICFLCAKDNEQSVVFLRLQEFSRSVCARIRQVDCWQSFLNILPMFAIQPYDEAEVKMLQSENDNSILSEQVLSHLSMQHFVGSKSLGKLALEELEYVLFNSFDLDIVKTVLTKIVESKSDIDVTVFTWEGTASSLGESKYDAGFLNFGYKTNPHAFPTNSSIAELSAATRQNIGFSRIDAFSMLMLLKKARRLYYVKDFAKAKIFFSECSALSSKSGVAELQILCEAESLANQISKHFDKRLLNDKNLNMFCEKTTGLLNNDDFHKKVDVHIFETLLIPHINLAEEPTTIIQLKEMANSSENDLVLVVLCSLADCLNKFATHLRMKVPYGEWNSVLLHFFEHMFPTSRRFKRLISNSVFKAQTCEPLSAKILGNLINALVSLPLIQFLEALFIVLVNRAIPEPHLHICTETLTVHQLCSNLVREVSWGSLLEDQRISDLQPILFQILSKLVKRRRDLESYDIEFSIISASIHFARKEHSLAGKMFLNAGWLSSSFFRDEVPRTVWNNDIVSQIVECCCALNSFLQAAIFCQFFTPVDFKRGLLCLNAYFAQGKTVEEEISRSTSISYFSFFWERPFLEVLINSMAKYENSESLKVVMGLMANPDLNIFNTDDSMARQIAAMKHQFLKLVHSEFCSQCM